LQQSLLLANLGLELSDSVFLSLGLGFRLLDRRSLGPSVSFELLAHALQLLSQLPVDQVGVSGLKLPGFSGHLEQFDWVAEQQRPHVVRHLVWVVNREVPDTILLAEGAGRRPRPLAMAKQAGLADQMLAVEKVDRNPAAGLALGLVW